jgi:hypothetical protein
MSQDRSKNIGALHLQLENDARISFSAFVSAILLAIFIRLFLTLVTSVEPVTFPTHRLPSLKEFQVPSTSFSRVLIDFRKFQTTF